MAILSKLKLAGKDAVENKFKYAKTLINACVFIRSSFYFIHQKSYFFY